jgi:hypothetical protein
MHGSRWDTTAVKRFLCMLRFRGVEIDLAANVLTATLNVV